MNTTSSAFKPRVRPSKANGAPKESVRKHSALRTVPSALREESGPKGLSRQLAAPKPSKAGSNAAADEGILIPSPSPSPKPVGRGIKGEGIRSAEPSTLNHQPSTASIVAYPRPSDGRGIKGEGSKRSTL